MLIYSNSHSSNIHKMYNFNKCIAMYKIKNKKQYNILNYQFKIVEFDICCFRNMESAIIVDLDYQSVYVCVTIISVSDDIDLFFALFFFSIPHQIRNKLNQEQNSKLQQQKELLNKRNMEVTLMDKRISELRDRLYKRKAEARQKENLPVRPGECITQSCFLVSFVQQACSETIQTSRE